MISLGLNLWSTTILARGGSDAYAVGGTSPSLVFDFSEEFYRTNSTTTTFDDAMTFSRSGNATMVDSDGLLKWAPHNLLTYSEQFDNASWGLDNSGATNPVVTANAGVAPDGTTTADRIQLDKTGGTFSRIQQVRSGLPSSIYTFSVWLKNNGTGVANVGIRIDLFSLNCEVNETWQLFTVSRPTAGTAASAQILLFDSILANDETADILAWGAHLYRSDLGGMVNNPDTGNSYVPTTSAARYLPRRGHHIYNGAEWVNEGVLVESEARTNLLTYSSEFDNAAWIKAGVSVASDTVTAPDGAQTADTLTASAGNSVKYAGISVVVSAATAHTLTFYAKMSTHRYVQLLNTGDAQAFANFDLLDGVIGSVGSKTTASIEAVGDGWYRITASFSSATVFLDLWRLYLTPSATSVFNATLNAVGTEAVHVYGAQLEQNASTPSSYIPTSGSTVTRAADSNTSGELTYDFTAMWFTLSGAETYADLGAAGQVELFDWRADANNRITVTLDTDGAEEGEITLTVVSGGTSWAVAADYLTPGISKPFSIAWRVTSSAINIAVGGTAAIEVSTTSIPDLSSASATLKGMGTRKLFRQGAGDVGDVGLEEATA